MTTDYRPQTMITLAITSRNWILFSLDGMRTHGVVALIAASTAALTLGCATPELVKQTITWGPVHTYSGTYVTGWEFSDFTPSGGSETWWLSGNLESIYRRTEGRHPELHNLLLVTVEGQLSSPGRYGHLGRFSHELRVTRVISVRQSR